MTIAMASRYAHLAPSAASAASDHLVIPATLDLPERTAAKMQLASRNREASWRTTSLFYENYDGADGQT